MKFGHEGKGLLPQLGDLLKIDHPSRCLLNIKKGEGDPPGNNHIYHEKKENHRFTCVPLEGGALLVFQEGDMAISHLHFEDEIWSYAFW